MHENHFSGMAPLTDYEVSIFHVTMELTLIAHPIFILQYTISLSHTFLEGTLELVAIDLTQHSFTMHQS